ncbi:hypothetical protein KKH27_06995 [bacterium]|nr:hypothetical protein [bacterium]MBU1983462.1 hypothetical protein [bacterium]
MIKVRKTSDKRIRQGDVFREIEYIEYATEESGIFVVSKIVFPLVFVLTQDCDLEQDYLFRWSGEPKETQDKWLLSVMVAPLYNAEHVYVGDHLTELSMKMQMMTPENKKRLKNNDIPRYHYLEFHAATPIVASVIDFKHYFAVDGRYLRHYQKQKFVCSISPLYRECISQRFASFLSRIGLPETHSSAPVVSANQPITTP